MNFHNHRVFANDRGIRAIFGLACSCFVGLAFGASPALIDVARKEAPPIRAVLGDAEQGRWLVSIDRQALAPSATREII